MSVSSLSNFSLNRGLIYNEQFGHLNYHYLEQLSQQDMVTGLPRVHFSDGVFHGCIISKHPEENYDKGKSWRAK